MNERPTRSDEELQRLLAHDSSEPPTALDDRIRAAAREAVTGVGTSARRRRRWQIPAGIGIAATVLLAVLVVERAPEPTLPAGGQASPPVTTSPSSIPTPQVTTQYRAQPMREADAAREASAAEALQDTACENAATTLDAGGLRVCVSAGHLEISSLSGGECHDSLRLIRDPGQVSIAAAANHIAILIDGRVRWQIRCADGAWQIDAEATSHQ
jgi:hypothetical protein